MSRGRTKTGIQRLTGSDLRLIISLLNHAKPSFWNTNEPVSLAFEQRREMILEKIEQEIKTRQAETQS